MPNSERYVWSCQCYRHLSCQQSQSEVRAVLSPTPMVYVPKDDLLTSTSLLDGLLLFGYVQWLNSAKMRTTSRSFIFVQQLGCAELVISDEAIFTSLDVNTFARGSNCIMSPCRTVMPPLTMFALPMMFGFPS